MYHVHFPSSLAQPAQSVSACLLAPGRNTSTTTPCCNCIDTRQGLLKPAQASKLWSQIDCTTLASHPPIGIIQRSICRICWEYLFSDRSICLLFQQFSQTTTRKPDCTTNFWILCVIMIESVKLIYFWIVLLSCARWKSAANLLISSQSLADILEGNVYSLLL
jgi:hypothetical protein